MKRILFCLLLFVNITIQAQIIIPFVNKDYSDLKVPIVKLLIDNKYYGFIVDSGANTSILDIDWCNKNTKLVNYIRTLSMNLNTISAETKNSSDFVYINLNNKDCTFITADLHLIINKAKDENFNIIGLLGADYLLNNQLIVDYKIRTLHQ